MKNSHADVYLAILALMRPAGEGLMLLLSVLCLAASAAMASQQPAAVPEPISNSQAGQSKMMAMPSVAPLFLEGAGFSSTLHLVNETTRPLEAHVDILSLDGVLVAERTFKVAALGLQLVSIHDLLRASAATLDIGSVRVSSNPSSDGLLAALAFGYSGKTESYFEEELPMQTKDGSNVLRGVADDGDASVVAIASLSTMVQHITVSCIRERGGNTSRLVELLPNQTLLEKPCSAEGGNSILSASDLAHEPLNFGGNQQQRVSAAISLATDGMPGQVAAYGIVPHSTQGDLFFTALNFTDPKLKKSGGAVYAGVPVGPSPLLTEGVYRPELSIANFGPKTASVSIESAVTTSGKPETQTLASISIASSEVKTLRLEGMPQAPDLRASVLVHTDAAPGDLVTKLVSRGQSRLPEVEILDKEISDGTNGGGHPWDISGDVTSVLLLFNHDTKSQFFNVRFGNTAGKNPWMKEYQLASMETLAININELIASREKDDKGHELLITQQVGEVGWQADTASVAGRVLQTSPAAGMARNFSCGNYYTICGPAIYPSLLELGFDQSSAFSGSEGWNLNHFGPSSSCSCSNPTSGNGSLYYSWSSGNSSIANITSGASSSSSQWFGQHDGQTTGTFSVTGPYGLSCQVQAAAATVSVQISTVTLNPTSISASGQGSTTATVQIYVPQMPLTEQSVLVSVATYSATPAGSNLSYQAAQKVEIGPGSTNLTSPVLVEFTAAPTSVVRLK